MSAETFLDFTWEDLTDQLPDINPTDRVFKITECAERPTYVGRFVKVRLKVIEKSALDNLEVSRIAESISFRLTTSLTDETGKAISVGEGYLVGAPREDTLSLNEAEGLDMNAQIEDFARQSALNILEQEGNIDNLSNALSLWDRTYEDAQSVKESFIVTYESPEQDMTTEDPVVEEPVINDDPTPPPPA